jgi:hypothetical protein
MLAVANKSQSAVEPYCHHKTQCLAVVHRAELGATQVATQHLLASSLTQCGRAQQQAQAWNFINSLRGLFTASASGRTEHKVQVAIILFGTDPENTVLLKLFIVDHKAGRDAKVFDDHGPTATT